MGANVLIVQDSGRFTLEHTSTTTNRGKWTTKLGRRRSMRMLKNPREIARPPKKKKDAEKDCVTILLFFD